MALKINQHQIQMNRVFLSVIAGIFCGIIRIEGVIHGLGVYIGWQLLGSLLMAIMTTLGGGGASITEFFPNGLRDIFLSEIFSGIMTFILVWTIVYDVVHIF